MSQRTSRLSEISLVTANFGEGVVLADVLQDWFHFLGGKPNEVVFIDCGSDPETQAICWQLYQDGLIDRLQVIHPDNDDFGRDKGFIKEYTAGAVASNPYLVLFKTDTLPYRQGHEGWLEEALNYLDRDDVFAISGAWNLPSKHHDAWDGWYFSKKCSYNFVVIKRDKFMAAAHEFAHDFILSGFTSENPAEATNQGRYFIEVAFEKYLERHNVYVLSRVEDINWTVFHTNTHNQLLKQVREDYLARRDVERFMNLGFSDKEPDPSKARYYGLPVPQVGFLKKLRIAFGASPLGTPWRSLKRRLPQKST